MEFQRGKRLNVDGSVEMDSFFTLDWNFECSSHIIWLHFRCNTKITIISFLELIVKCMVSSYLIESYSNRTELCYFQINARNIIFFMYHSFALQRNMRKNMFRLQFLSTRRLEFYISINNSHFISILIIPPMKICNRIPRCFHSEWNSISPKNTITIFLPLHSVTMKSFPPFRISIFSDGNTRAQASYRYCGNFSSANTP